VTHTSEPLFSPFSAFPAVDQAAERGERPFDVFNQLLSNRVVFVGSEINDKTANLVVAQLLLLSQQDPNAMIRMYINSPGGVIYSGMAIYDTMQTIPNPVATLAVGVTASFGTVLLTAGAKGHRYALPHATIHMHQPLGGAQGQASEIEIQAREILRLKSSLNEIMSRHTGQPVETIIRDTERDYYMTPEQAVEYGLIDEVMKIPEKKLMK
jgi:ATP-dependent Clp protease, protease subunit